MLTSALSPDENRYIVGLAASDFTGQLWLSGFNEIGVQLFGMSAGEMEQVLVSLQSALVSSLSAH